MIAFRWDTKGALDLRWPETDVLILALGKQCRAKEAALPAAERCGAVPLALLNEAITAVEVAAKEAGTGEQERAEAAEVRRQALAAAKPEIERVFVLLKAKYYANLAQLEQWGLRTKVGAKGVVVLKPQGEKQEIAFLQAFVAQEQSLAPAEQVDGGNLARLAGYAQSLSQSTEARGVGRTKREVNVKARSAAGERLLRYVQAMAVSLTAVRFNGVVTNELQEWGFDVVAAKSAGSSQPPAGGGAE